MSEPNDPTELAGISDMGTESITAWSLEEGEDTDDYPAPRRRGLTPRTITALAVAASMSVTVAVALLVHAELRGLTETAAAPSATSSPPSAPQSASPMTTTPASATPAAPASPSVLRAPLSPSDAEFVAEMRGYGVPVVEADPAWTVKLANAVCATARDGGPVRYPPGTFTLGKLAKGVMEVNPEWTLQQATRLVAGAVGRYCPEVAGPSPREMAAMPPDQRYLAMLADQLGITPSDGSLVAGARQVCAVRGRGVPADQIAAEMNSPNSPQDERVIVDVAIQVYCPQYSGR